MRLSYLGPAILFCLFFWGVIIIPSCVDDAYETQSDRIDCDSDMDCELATGYPYETALGPNPPKYPRLVGHGCQGASGPIYAFEEDHLPPCDVIEPMDWDWLERMA